MNTLGYITCVTEVVLFSNLNCLTFGEAKQSHTIY